MTTVQFWGSCGGSETYIPGMSPEASLAVFARSSGVMHAVLASLLAATALPAAATATAPATLIPGLEQRLAASGPDRVNAYLASNWASAMIPLNRKAATCEPRAITLAVRLSRSRDAKVASAHV